MSVLQQVKKILEQTLPRSRPRDSWRQRVSELAPHPTAGSRAGWYNLAVVQGAASASVGQAFVGGYQCALRRLFGAHAGTDPGDTVALAASEQKGGHPRAMQCTLQREGTGWWLRGTKSFVTMGPQVERLFVVARTGTQPDGRPRLKVVSVAGQDPGLRWQKPFVAPFVPDISHCAVELDCQVAPDFVLPGDGYLRWVKPFRTVEDLHVAAAVGGLFLYHARRYKFAEEVLEEACAWLAAGHTLAAASPTDPTTHIALAGWLRQWAVLANPTRSFWDQVPEEIRAGLLRDWALFSVAAKAREARRSKAWDLVQG